MKTQKIFSRILDGMILTAFLLFFSSAGFQDKSTSGWYQQFFPNLNGSSITSITFLDSLTGYAVTNPGTSINSYILKTTNGGDNWIINYTYNSGANIRFTAIQFANDSIGYAATNFFTFFKTTNAGLNWIQLTTPDGAEGMAVINVDTVLVVVSDGFAGGVYRTTNGGYNWQAMGQTGGSGQPSTIYMYNKDMGFCLGGQMRKTTNGGVNWFTIPGESYTSIMFVDSLTGWKCYDSIKKTTNGGLNWYAQQTPNVSQGFWGPSSFSAINKDTIWMVGALSNYTNPVNPIYKTTNGGLNWGYQNADSTHIVGLFGFIQFVNDKVGWAKSGGQTYELHTVTGGNDTTYITGINNNLTSVPKDFALYQNYPNPFNNSTIINYKLSIKGEIKLIIYNIMGKEVNTLINKKQTAGTYDVSFNAGNLSSGVYFYSLFADGLIIDTKRMLLIK